MVRVYKPKEKISKVCVCGCGRIVVGNAKKQYFSQSCKTKAMRQRQKADTTA